MKKSEIASALIIAVTAAIALTFTSAKTATMSIYTKAN